MKTYGLKKDNYISISIDLAPVHKTSKKSVIQSTPIQTSKNKITKNIDVNNLFSDVWTQKINNKKKVVKPKNSKRIREIQKLIKPTQDNNIKSVSDTINKIDAENQNSQKKTSSSADEVNEYLAKIQSIVYQHFNVPPNSEGNSVRTVITLDPFGKLLDFRVLNYSSNEALNQEADKIKDRLVNVVFPINPENKTTRTIVVLISKE
jgi:protein TonB